MPGEQLAASKGFIQVAVPQTHTLTLLIDALLDWVTVDEQDFCNSANLWTQLAYLILYVLYAHDIHTLDHRYLGTLTAMN